MVYRALAEATEFTDAWVDFAVARKVWGYAAERRPSTHPVAGRPAPDAAPRAAELRRHLLRQGRGGAAAARSPTSATRRSSPGVRDHLTAHAYGNADLADLLAAMERASGKDLQAWADAWLRTARLDTVSLDVETEGGVVTAARLDRVAPDGEAVQRPHSLDVAGFADGAEVFRVDTVAEQDVTELPALVGRPAARLVVPNAGDLTWATVRLDEATLRPCPGSSRRCPTPWRAPCSGPP